jgi:Bacterial transcriptional activator domain
VLREALALSRGPPLADFTYEAFAQAAIPQLEELHLAAVEGRLQADLALGRDGELAGELRDLIERHPLRERLRGQLMLALYRSGRQAEALEVYQEFRRGLSEQLGLNPGPGLERLQLAILDRDPTLEVLANPAASGAPRGSSPTPPDGAARSDRRRLRLAAVGSVLFGLLLAAALIASSGGRVPPEVIPDDSVGAISLSGAIRAVVPLGSSPSAVAADRTPKGVVRAPALRGHARRRQDRPLRRRQTAQLDGKRRPAPAGCSERSQPHLPADLRRR